MQHDLTNIKVAVFCKTFLKGGAEKQALTLSKLLVRENIDTYIISWQKDNIDDSNRNFIDDNNLKFIGLKGCFLNKLYQFIRILRKYEINIVISYLTLANFVSGVSKFFNKELVSIGGIRNEHLPYYKLIFEKWIHNYLSDLTVFNNYSAKEKFSVRGFNTDKICVIHNAVSNNRHEETLKPAGKELQIFTVARFVEQKDFKTALNTIKILAGRNRNKSFKYVIAGYGPLESEIRAMIVQLGISGYIQIHINPPDVSDLLHNSDIFLSTSLFEGLSNSIMEAMSAGLPVVATDVGDNRYLVKDGVNGFLVPCRDYSQLADKLELILESEDLRKEFGENGRKLIEKNFSEDKLIDNYIELLGKFIERQS